MRNSIKLALLLAGVCVVIGFMALTFGDRIGGVSAMSGLSTGELKKPMLNVGDWWTVEQSLQNVPEAVRNPSWIVSTWKMEVTGIESVDGVDCYVIQSTSPDYPDAKKTAYYSVKDLSLTLYDSFGSGGYHKTYGKDDLGNAGNPRPYLAPTFPARATSVAAADVSFVLPGEASAARTPDVAKMNLIGGNASFSKVYIDVGNSYKVTQIWHPGAPWWVYHDEPILKARMVDCSWWHK